MTFLMREQSISDQAAEFNLPDRTPPRSGAICTAGRRWGAAWGVRRHRHHAAIDGGDQVLVIAAQAAQTPNVPDFLSDFTYETPDRIHMPDRCRASWKCWEE